MNEYNLKSVKIKAVQWLGDNFEEVRQFCPSAKVEIGTTFLNDCSLDNIIIKTLAGYSRLSLGDYIIQCMMGEFYYCKGDTFEMLYERND